MSNKILFNEVFTPTRPARRTFVEREAINDKLVNSLRTPGKQIVVYGHSGSGKTTLLVNKLHQTYEHHVTTRCMAGLTFDQLVLNAFDQLEVFYEKERSNKINKKLAAEYSAIKAEISSGIESKTDRVLPLQLTPQNLGRFLGEASSCWVLEDFHKIDESEKRHLSQVMKIFMDMADDYPTLKSIAIGAVDTARQVIQYDPEMKNRVAEILVPLMTREEILRIPEIGSKLLKFHIPPSINNWIVSYSNGLPSVCHQICLNICLAADIVEPLDEPLLITREIFERAIQTYLDEASDSLKVAFDKAFKRERERKFDNGKLILEALTNCSENGATYAEILRRIRAKEHSYPPGNLTLYLNQLQTDDRGSIIRYDSMSGKYSFADPIYGAFARVFFEQEARSKIRVIRGDRKDGALAELLPLLKEWLLEAGKAKRQMSDRSDPNDAKTS